MSFDPYWDLFCGGARQTLSGESNDFGATCRGTCEAVLSNGNCVIRVSDTSVDGAGQYNLTLEAVSGGFAGISNGPPAPTCQRGQDGTQPIGCGETLPRAIDVVGETDTFTFEARTGDVVSIAAARVGGAVSPVWRLFSPSGAPVSLSGDTRGTPRCYTSPCDATLLVGGVYTISVDDDGRDAIGPYRLTLSFLTGCVVCGNGQLDPGEQCDSALSGCCTSACVFAAVGTVCRPSAGICDVAEVCDGTNNTCPADAKNPSGTVCRTSAGVCDPQETCDGTSNNCPADVKRPSGTMCRASVGVCDPQEECNGTSNDCPADVKRPSGTVCRAAAGPCDVREVCDGTNNNCPADAFKSSSTECRASAGACDPTENCPGTGPTCPADVKSPSGTVCGPSVGVCDVQEACDGSGNNCPANAFFPSSTVCRAAAGVCDRDEFCPGSGANCPADVKKTSGTVCRAALDVCDVAEVCDGTSNGCPADTLAPAGTVCRAPRGVCDVTETCDGIHTACPTDEIKPNGIPCDDGQFCTDPDSCQGGTCIGPIRGCSDNKSCTADTCNEVNHCVSTPTPGACDDGNSCTEDQCGAGSAPSGCAHTVVVGQTCTDGLACTEGETCHGGGTCSGGQPRECSVGQCQVGACREPGGCVTTAVSDGQSCDDGDPCTGGDTCRSGVCAGTAQSCDDQNPCTVDRCDGSGACTHMQANGGACEDDDACTDDDACGAGVCAGRRACDVRLSCEVTTGGSVCRVSCAGACRIRITVTILGRPRSRCSVVLFEATATQSPRRSVTGAALTQEAVQKPRRLSRKVTGTIDESGKLELAPKLNKLARRLVKKNGEVAADAEVQITEPQSGGGAHRVLKRVVDLVRGG